MSMFIIAKGGLPSGDYVAIVACALGLVGLVVFAFLRLKRKVDRMSKQLLEEAEARRVEIDLQEAVQPRDRETEATAQELAASAKV